MTTAANRVLCGNQDAFRFVTLFHAALDGPGRQITYVNAGHPAAFLFQSDRIQTLKSTGPALEIFSDVVFEQQTFRMAPGDLLVTYSDGISEAQDHKGRFFEDQGIQDVVMMNRNLSPGELADAICESADAFEDDMHKASDDKTEVVIRCIG